MLPVFGDSAAFEGFFGVGLDRVLKGYPVEGGHGLEDKGVAARSAEGGPPGAEGDSEAACR